MLTLKMQIMEEMKRKKRKKLIKVKIKEHVKAVIKKTKSFTQKKTIRKKSSLKCKVINQVLITGQNLQNLGKHFKILTRTQIKH